MTILPNRLVWEEADEFEHASRLCLENKIYWPAVVNAALAIEIYLKSFSSEDNLISVGESPVNQVFGNRVSGHGLYDLYFDITPSLREKISELNRERYDFPSVLKKYNFAFIKYRYGYEVGSPKIADDTLPKFAAHLKSITHAIFKENFA